MLAALIEILWWFQPEATSSMGGDAPAASAPPGCAGGGMNVGLLVVMVAAFYFLLIRPQQKRQREHDQMLKALKKGMVVRTNGGIRGEVTELTDSEVVLAVADKTRINVLRSHIAGLDGAPGAESK